MRPRRWVPALLAGGLLAARPAAADYYAPPPPVTPPADTTLWQELVEPHGAEVADILVKAQEARQYAANHLLQDTDPDGRDRARLLDDAYGMLRYARRRAPANRDVLRLLGLVAETSGRSAAAVEALTTLSGLLPPDAPVDVEAHTSLARAYLRLGRRQDAVRQLQRAVSRPGPGPGTFGGSPHALLALVLMHDRRMAEAIDAVAAGVDPANAWSVDGQQAAFTLAVALDRDEQHSAAYRVIDLLQQAFSSSYAGNLQGAVAQLGFVPAYDQHYFLGLLYETVGALQEARVEWLLYAQAEGAPYRDRALQHAEAIDGLLAAQLAAAQAAQAARPRPAPARARTRSPAPPPAPRPWPGKVTGVAP